MALSRFFIEGDLPTRQPGADLRIPLNTDDLHHALRVLRIRTGESVSIVDPTGGGIVLSVRGIDDAGLVGTVLGALEPPTLPRVTLIQGVAKGDSTDLVVRMAVEIGVERVIPVLFERSVVALKGDRATKRGERWRAVAAAAAKQSDRYSVPLVDDPQTLAQVLPELDAFDRVLVAWEESEGGSISSALSDLDREANTSVAIVVGPEGGLTSDEVESLRSLGARIVSLGATVLRSETAGAVATALVAYELGGLGSSSR